MRWTYAAQRADVMSGGAVGPARVVSQLGGFGTLGTRVDGGGGMSAKVHEDAVTVHEVCMSHLSAGEAMLVMMHGRQRSRPDPRIGARWRMEPRTWHLQERAPGSGEWLKVAMPEYSDRRKGWFVPVVQVDNPREVERDREEWATWRFGLVTLLDYVGPRLARHTLTDELPEAEPWLAGA